MRVFDPVGLVGDLLEVEGEAGCGFFWVGLLACRVKSRGLSLSFVGFDSLFHGFSDQQAQWPLLARS